MIEWKRITSDRKRIALMFCIPLICLILFFYQKTIDAMMAPPQEYRALVEEWRDSSPEEIVAALSEQLELPWILKVVLSWQMMNFWVWPDFVAYRFRDRSHPSNWFARKLWKINGVSWTLKSQQELNQALTDNCLGIFEGFSPE